MDHTYQDFSLQGDEISALHEMILRGRMVHALLITGGPGTGKRTLSRILSATLLCRSGRDSNKPCGVCNGCQMAFSGEHPDLIMIEKGNPLSGNVKKGRATIPVDDIREMITLCSSYPLEGGNRVVQIPDAENMTAQAQNSLLKILEEPPVGTYFILTSSHPEQLLTTVRSRCRTVKLKPWPAGYIQRVLTESGTAPDTAAKASRASFGSIGSAFRLAGNNAYWKIREEAMNAFFRCGKRSEILLFSNAWKDRKNDADTLLDILEDDVQLLLLSRIDQSFSGFPEPFPDEWLRFASSAGLERFSFLKDRISDARKQLASNVNLQAVLEQLLLSFIGERDLWSV